MNIEVLRKAVEAAVEHLESSGCDERTYDYLNEHFGNEGDCSLVKLHKQLKNALALSRRNCDVGTVEEQSKRFGEFCYRYDSCSTCPVKKNLGKNHGTGRDCRFAWSQLPYEEGDVK